VSLREDSIEWIDVSFSNKGKVESAEAIKSAIVNIISTTPGERLFLPRFGCNLEHILFEPVDEDTALLIRVELYQCLEDNDPRIRMLPNSTQIIPHPDDNLFEIYLHLEILGIGDFIYRFNLNSLE